MKYTNERAKLEIRRVSDLRDDIHKAELLNSEIEKAVNEADADAARLLDCLTELQKQLDKVG